MAPSAIETHPSADLPTKPSLQKILSSSKNPSSLPEVVFGDFRDDLIRDGFAVVKGAVPKTRADGYARDFYAMLEGL